MAAFTPCDPCLRSNERQVADNWCTICKEYLCSDCTSHHKKLKILINHSLMPIKVKERINRKIHELPVTCERHKDQPFRFYCPDHQALFCEQCCNINHGNCCSVVEIEQAASKLSFLPQFQNHVTETKMKLEEILHRRNAEKQSMENENNRIQNEIKSFRQEINNRLDELERKVVQSLTTVHSSRIRNIDNFRQQLLDIETDLNRMSKDVDILFQNVSNKHLFVVVTLLSKKIQEYSNNLSNLSYETETNELKWNKPGILLKIEDFGSICSQSLTKPDARSKINKTCEANKDSCQRVNPISNYATENRSREVAVRDLGVLTGTNIVQHEGDYCNQRRKRRHGCTTSILEVNASKRPTSTQVVDYVKYHITPDDFNDKSDRKPGPSKPTLHKKLDICSALGTHAYIDRCCFFQEDKLVLADTEKGSVYFCEQSGKLLRTIQCKVMDVEYSRNGKLFIAVAKKGIFEVDQDDFSLHRYFPSENCYGIASFGDKVAARIGKKKIHIIDSNGIVLSRHSLPLPISNFCVDDKGNIFFTSERDDAVTSYNTDSKFFRELVHFKFKNHELKNARGVVLDINGNVYVSGYDSNNIFKIRPDGISYSILLNETSGIEQPFDIAISDLKQELLIINKDHTSIEIFKI